MWVPLIRSVSRQNLAKYHLIFRFGSVASLAQLPFSDVSDSGSEENSPFLLNNNNNISSFNHAHQVFDKRSVTETLDYLEGQPRAALCLISQLKECGFTHDVVTYMAIIRFMCHWGMISRLKCLFLEVIEDKNGAFGFGISDLLEELLKEINVDGQSLFVRAVDALIKAFISVRQFDDAEDVLKKIQGHCVPSVLTCNLLLNQLVEEGEVDEAILVYERLKRNGFCPNVYTYGIVVKGLCRKGLLEEAGDVFREMEETGVEPNAFTYGLYIGELCSNGYTEPAFVALKMLRQSGSPVDGFAYASVIRGFLRELKLEDAENVFLEMKQLAIVPDAYCYGALIQWYCKKRNILKAVDLLGEMYSNGININCVIVSSIMQCLCQLGMFSDAVYEFITATEAGVFLDEISFTIAMDALCRQKKMNEAVLLLDEMKLKKMSPDVKHYTTLINGYCLSDDFENALKIFNKMKENGIKPDTVTFNVLLGWFSKGGFYEKTMVLLDNMVELGLEPTSATHNIVIEGLCKSGKVKEAGLFFDNLETKRLNTYVAMINGYCDSNNLEKAYQLFLRLPEQEKTSLLAAKNDCFKLFSGLCEKGEIDVALMLFKKILESGNGPSKILCSKLTAAYCRAGDMMKARWVFDRMIERGIPPDAISYTIMLHGYYRANCLKEAHDVYNDMLSHNIQPDIVTCTVLFDGESKAYWNSKIREEKGSEHKGLLKYKAAMQKFDPDVICFTVLIDHYCKTNKPRRGKFILREMIERGLQPDTIAYTSLIKGYCSHGFVEALTLYDKMCLVGVKPDLRTWLAFFSDGDFIYNWKTGKQGAFHPFALQLAEKKLKALISDTIFSIEAPLRSKTIVLTSPQAPHDLLSSWQIHVTELRKKQESDALKEQLISVQDVTTLTERGSVPLSLNAPAITTGGGDAISPVPSSALDLMKKKLQDYSAPATTESDLDGSIPVDQVGKGLLSKNGKDKLKDDNGDGSISSSSSGSDEVDGGPTEEELAIQFKEMVKEHEVCPFSKREGDVSFSFCNY